MDLKDAIVRADDRILVTGATGFIGPRVIESLLSYGFRNVLCLARSSPNSEKLATLLRRRSDGARVELIQGDLLSRQDCMKAAKDAAVIFHLAAGRGEKSFPDAFLNSVVTTRNLLEAGRQQHCLRRFVSISSFSVYSNRNKPRGRVLDESCPIEDRPERRGDAYTFAKVKQDEMVTDYGKRFGVPYVIVRPGFVYGAGNEAITGRVGIGTFGFFLHLGGANSLPLTYVDNCAEAIVLAGIRPGVEGEVFNVVDDDLPSSRRFLRLYKRNVRRFSSIYLPHGVSYLLCYLWEKYSHFSKEQLPPVFNRRVWHAYWKRTEYSNERLKTRLGWSPRFSSADALQKYFEDCRTTQQYA